MHGGEEGAWRRWWKWRAWSPPGSLVEFYQDRKVICGLCLKNDKKGLHVLSEETAKSG